MPTREERREVAERLREAIIDDGHLEMPGGKKGFQMTLQRIIGTSNPTRPALYARLAYLIDPTCHLVSDADNHMPHCDMCGTGIYGLPTRYCPNCGAMVVDE